MQLCVYLYMFDSNKSAIFCFFFNVVFELIDNFSTFEFLRFGINLKLQLFNTNIDFIR